MKKFHEQKWVALGLLFTMVLECITQNYLSLHITSYVFEHYSTDDNFRQSSIKLKGWYYRKKRANVTTFTNSTLKQGIIHSNMTYSCALTGVKEKSFSSTFQLGGKHTRINNEFYLKKDQQSNTIDTGVVFRHIYTPNQFTDVCKCKCKQCISW